MSEESTPVHAAETRAGTRRAVVGVEPVAGALAVLREHLDLVAGAHDWVRQIRHLVRTLAVTGRLVPQVEGDEDARAVSPFRQDTFVHGIRVCRARTA